MDGQKVFKTLDFLFLVTLNNIENLYKMDLVFECQMLVCEWEGFRLESFRNYRVYLLARFIMHPTSFQNLHIKQPFHSQQKEKKKIEGMERE